MSILLMSRIFKQPMGGATRKALAVRLADFADDEGRGIWPSVDRLSAETELSVRTVQRLLSDFVEEGILILVKKASGRPGEANRYDFDLDRLFAAHGSQENNPAGKTTGDTVTPVAGVDTGVTEAETGDTDDIDGCHGVTRTVIEPPVNLQEREGASERDGQDGNSVRPIDKQQILKRVKAMELGAKPAYSGTPWPGAAGSSTQWAAQQFANLSDADRAEAERLRDAYLDHCNRSGVRPVALGVYLRDRKFEGVQVLPKDAAPRLVGDRVVVPVLGPVFAAAYMAEVLARPAPIRLPDNHRETILKSAEALSIRNPQRGRDYLANRGIDLDADGKPIFPATFERDEERRLRMTEGYPGAKRLYDAAKERAHATVAQRFEAFKNAMEFVPVDSEMMSAWRGWFEKHFLPFPPLTARGGYFPAGGPDRLDDFRAALARESDEGEHDAA